MALAAAKALADFHGEIPLKKVFQLKDLLGVDGGGLVLGHDGVMRRVIAYKLLELNLNFHCQVDSSAE